MRIGFRADASATIGAGHLMRCATLADVLRARGDSVVFFCRTLPGHQCDALGERGFDVVRLPDNGQTTDPAADFAQVHAACHSADPFDWFIVDHYQLDARWESAARQTLARHIAVIDDLADRPHDCDLLVDQNLRPTADNPYLALNARPAQTLLGPRFALLRPAFAVLHGKVAPRSGVVRRIVVCFGGADPHNHTGATLEILRDRMAELDRVDVFAGNSCPHRADIAARCHALGASVVLHPADADPVTALSTADLAVGAGGTMNWERACLGVPTVAFGIAENQHQVLEALLEQGYILGASALPQPEPASMARWLDIALTTPALLRGLAQRNLQLVDGKGAERVVQAMDDACASAPSRLALRPATAADRDNLLTWRNAPDIRAVSLDSEPITPEAHAAWLARTLDNPARRLLIAERAGQPVGVVRFDLKGPEATISVYRVPGATGRLHLIAHATDWLRHHHPTIRRIIAEVLPSNDRSLAAFRAAGYRETKSVLVNDLETS